MRFLRRKNKILPALSYFGSSEKESPDVKKMNQRVFTQVWTHS